MLFGAFAALAAGCSSSAASTVHATGPQPHTNAKLVILDPKPNSVTGSTVTVVLSLTGARLVSTTTGTMPNMPGMKMPATTTGSTTNGGGPISPTEGHIHLYVDSKFISMSYAPTATITGLSPGPHSIRAEFVATNHLPFANRVVATVVFTVRR